jgi:hypothetical protein
MLCQRLDSQDLQAAQEAQRQRFAAESYCLLL